MPTSKYHPYKGKGGHAARCALCVKTTPAGLAGWVEIHVEGEAASYRSGQSVRAIGQVTTQMAEIIKACDNLVPALIPLAHRTCAESAAAALAVGKRLQGQEQPMPSLCSTPTQAAAQPGPAHAPCPHHLPDHHPSQSQLQGLLHLPGLSILTRPATNPPQRNTVHHTPTGAGGECVRPSITKPFVAMPMFDQKRDDKHWDDECLTLLCSFAPDSVMQLCTLGKKLSVKMLNEYCKAPVTIEMHENDACMKLRQRNHEECRSVQLHTHKHISSRGQPGAARSSEKQYTKLVSALASSLEPWRVPSSPASIAYTSNEGFTKESRRKLAFCRAIQDQEAETENGRRCSDAAMQQCSQRNAGSAARLSSCQEGRRIGRKQPGLKLTLPPILPISASVPLPIPLRSNSHDVSPLPSSLTNTQQQPADISDERQPFTSSTLTMTGWSRLQPETAYPTFPSHTQEPAKGPRGAAKTRGKEAQH
ncbi:hypothetical protein QJQ45_019020 [Haematococcus lacustris]|nr:hypothetical protein QJQ45_019020 [Haematococcus lacustris]